MHYIAFLFWATLAATLAIALWDCARWPRQTTAAWQQFLPVTIAIVALAALFFAVNFARFGGAEAGRLGRLAVRLAGVGLGAALFYCAGWPWVARAGHTGLFERIRRRRAGLSTGSVRRSAIETLAVVTAIPAFSFAYFTVIKSLVAVQQSDAFRRLFEAPESLESRSGYLFLFIGMAPLWEEALFRWYLLNRLDEALAGWRGRRWTAILATSALWACGHATLTVPSWVKMGHIFVVGCVLAWRFPVIGFSGCVLAHLVMNLLTVFSLT